MSIFQRLAELEGAGEPAALVTVIRDQGSVPRHAGAKMIVFPDGRIEGTIGGGELESRVIEEALAALADGRTRRMTYAFRDPEQGDVGVCGGEMEVFVEPLGQEPQLVIIGGGHVGKAVAHLGKWLGFRVVVCDDRPEFALTEAVPDADAHVVCALGEVPQRVGIHSQSYVVLTTRGVQIDLEGLPALLETPAAYIGVIGSRRRWETTAEALLERGVPAEAIERIVSPMGLELNAETPEEIAVSILAEIIMRRRGGTGERMAHRPSRLQQR